MKSEAESNETRGPRLAPLAGRHVYLRAITPADYSHLHQAETSETIGPAWRFRGATPSPEQWAQTTWAGTVARFLVISRLTNAPVGVVAAHQASFQDGHAHISGARFEDSRSPLMVLGMVLFVDYVFTCWNFRKLYMEVPEYNFPQIASGLDRVFQLEGRLKDHTFLAGRHWDHLYLALYRESWAAATDRVRRLALGH